MTEEALLKRIRRLTDGRTQKKSANKFGVSQAYLNQILTGARPITDEVARKFGYRQKQREFEKIKE